jgi:hypothetical protein
VWCSRAGNPYFGPTPQRSTRRDRGRDPEDAPLGRDSSAGETTGRRGSRSRTSRC